MSFEKIWERIKEVTNINKFNVLADIVGTTQQYISRKKNKDEFPVDWAFTIAQKYELSTDWIMTGKEFQKNKTSENRFLTEIEEWITDIEEKDPGRAIWFEMKFQDDFPQFKEWKQRRENNWSKDNNSEGMAA